MRGDSFLTVYLVVARLHPEPNKLPQKSMDYHLLSRSIASQRPSHLGSFTQHTKLSVSVCISTLEAIVGLRSNLSCLVSHPLNRELTLAGTFLSSGLPVRYKYLLHHTERPGSRHFISRMCLRIAVYCRRLGQLFWRLNSGEVSPPALALLKDLSQALQSRDYQTASQKQVHTPQHQFGSCDSYVPQWLCVGICQRTLWTLIVWLV